MGVVSLIGRQKSASEPAFSCDRGGSAGRDSLRVRVKREQHASAKTGKLPSFPVPRRFKKTTIRSALTANELEAKIMERIARV